jgi:hypothetical protein
MERLVQREILVQGVIQVLRALQGFREIQV